jgi:hypothetical protein
MGREAELDAVSFFGFEISLVRLLLMAKYFEMFSRIGSGSEPMSRFRDWPVDSNGIGGVVGL